MKVKKKYNNKYPNYYIHCAILSPVEETIAVLMKANIRTLVE